MCGIVGAVADRDIVPILIEGLKRLEYRGYDSCGVAIHGSATPAAGAGLRRARSVARVADLDAQVSDGSLKSGTGIAHTRWATHGAPVTVNAHPHFSRDEVALVHNGIIENHDELRDELKAQGYVFESQTDTEVIAHLVHSLYKGNLFTAVQAAVLRLNGAYAIGVFCKAEPNVVVGARAGSPLVVGIGHGDSAGENFIASDALAIAGTTDHIAYLEEGDVVEIRRDGVTIVEPIWKKAMWWKYAATASPSSTATATRSSAKCAWCRPPPAWWSWAPTATSCRRKSSSSRAPWPIRSKAWKASPPASSATAPRASSGRSTKSASSPAAPATTAAPPPSTGSNPSRRFPPRWKWRANTATATACPTRMRWWW